MIGFIIMANKVFAELCISVVRTECGAEPGVLWNVLPEPEPINNFPAAGSERKGSDLISMLTFPCHYREPPLIKFGTPCRALVQWQN